MFADTVAGHSRYRTGSRNMTRIVIIQVVLLFLLAVWA